jgi:transcription elongation factor Elf1
MNKEVIRQALEKGKYYANLVMMNKKVFDDTIEELEKKHDPAPLPCCGYLDVSAVKWNPLNGVVQCHNCGHTYTPIAEKRKPPLTAYEACSMSEKIDFGDAAQEFCFRSGLIAAEKYHGIKD